MNPYLSTMAVLESIAEAQDAHQLHHISRVIIPKLKGASEAHKDDLQQSVRLRFSALNAAAVGEQKVRFKLQEAA